MKVVAVVAGITVLVLGCDQRAGGGSGGDFAARCAFLSGCTGGEVRFLCQDLAWADGWGGSSRTTADRLRLGALTCATSAATCDEVMACFVASADQLARCPDSRSSICEGDVLIDCEDRERRQCGLGGLSCVEPTPGAASCVAGTCTSPGSARCDGATISVCSPAGMQWTYDCLSSDGWCRAEGPGGIWCSSPGAPEDCVELAGVPTCAGTGEACDQETFQATCDGPVVVTCAGGFPARLPHDHRLPGRGLHLLLDGAPQREPRGPLRVRRPRPRPPAAPERPPSGFPEPGPGVPQVRLDDPHGPPPGVRRLALPPVVPCCRRSNLSPRPHVAVAGDERIWRGAGRLAAALRSGRRTSS